MDKPAKSVGCATPFLSSPCSAHARGSKTNNSTTAAAEQTVMVIVDRTSGSFRTGKRSQENEPNRFRHRPCTHGGYRSDGAERPLRSGEDAGSAIRTRQRGKYNDQLAAGCDDCHQ